MPELLVGWLVLMSIALIIARSRRGEGTLLLAYFLGLSLIHVPGALNLIGTVVSLPSAPESLVGFRATLIGMAALLVGATGARMILQAPAVSSGKRTPGDGQLHLVGRILLAVGVVTNFLLLPLSTLVPSLTSLTGIMGSFLIVGYWMLLADAMDEAREPLVGLLLALLPIMPFATLLFSGFAGFGIMWVIIVVCFYLCRARRIWPIVLVSPLVVWFGLSLAVAYLDQRADIRQAVWVEQAGLADRTNKIAQIANVFEIYDPNNPDHVLQIDKRLNQNFLVGRGILRHQEGLVPLLHGSTVQPTVLIPRVLWPGKPDVGGGGDIVSIVTGIEFVAGTSVGVGQTLEFYANFGWPGLVVGFLVLGALLVYCDRGLAVGFANKDLRAVLAYGLPGVALIQPGGNLIEIIVAVVAAIIMARVTAMVIDRWLEARHNGQLRMSSHP